MPSSLDGLRNQIQDAELVLKNLDMEMEKIQFDPLVQSSVEGASDEVSRLIEVLLADFKTNPILQPLVQELKSQYLDGIQEQVAAARLK